MRSHSTCGVCMRAGFGGAPSSSPASGGCCSSTRTKRVLHLRRWSNVAGGRFLPWEAPTRFVRRSTLSTNGPPMSWDDDKFERFINAAVQMARGALPGYGYSHVVFPYPPEAEGICIQKV